MLESLQTVFASGELAFPVWLTLRACACGLVLFVLLAVPLAFYTARSKSLLSKCLLFASTLPLIFPPVALGYLLLLLLGRNGLLGAPLFAATGLRLIFSEPAVYLAAFIAGLPLIVRPVREAFTSPRMRDLEEAARICGLGPMQVFLSVSLPLARNAIASALLLALARCAGEVGITLMLGGNIEGRTTTLSLEIFNAVGRGDFDLATGLCIVLAAIAVSLYGLLQLSRKEQSL
jgi:molybdate transport system permease protein